MVGSPPFFFSDWKFKWTRWPPAQKQESKKRCFLFLVWKYLGESWNFLYAYSDNACSLRKRSWQSSRHIHVKSADNFLRFAHLEILKWKTIKQCYIVFLCVHLILSIITTLPKHLPLQIWRWVVVIVW